MNSLGCFFLYYSIEYLSIIPLNMNSGGNFFFYYSVKVCGEINENKLDEARISRAVMYAAGIPTFVYSFLKYVDFWSGYNTSFGCDE